MNCDDAIPGKNERSAISAPAAFSAPDAAAPRFNDGRPPARPGEAPLTPPARTSPKPEKKPAPALIDQPSAALIVIVFILLATLAALIVMASGDARIPCEDAPDWNQYDCEIS